jgi:hypothetical protein
MTNVVLCINPSAPESLTSVKIPLLENSTAVKVRTLAKVRGKIIAMSPALGYATQVMTRCIFSVELLTASTSDQDLCMTNVVFCINPAAPESLASLKISKLEVFSNNEALGSKTVLIICP